MKRTPVIARDLSEGADITIGYIDGKTFFRRVNQVQNMLVTRRAYALHDSVLDQLVDAGVETIVLQEPNRRLVSTIEDWQDLGQLYDGPRGVQTSLAIRLMAVQ